MKVGVVGGGFWYLNSQISSLEFCKIINEINGKLFFAKIKTREILQKIIVLGGNEKEIRFFTTHYIFVKTIILRKMVTGSLVAVSLFFTSTLLFS